MNDPRRPGRPQFPGPGSTQRPSPPNPPPIDPAYADQAHYAPAYGNQVPPWEPQWRTNPSDTTQVLPQYWQQDQLQPGAVPQGPPNPQPPPEGPKSPRWLWVAAGAAVLLVVALATALVIANGAVKQQTTVPALTAMPEPSSITPTTTTRTTSASAPTTTSSSDTPSETTDPALQSVVYDVTGDGRAISVTYMDTGDVIQTEFNVALPWSKQVSLSKSTTHPASITIVNIGHNVTCSVMVAGVQVRQRTGVGITICDSSG